MGHMPAYSWFVCYTGIMANTLENTSQTASLFDLTGKVALVTGATGKLGSEICMALAEMGADLAMVARTEEPLLALQAQLQEQTGRHPVVFSDTIQHAENVQTIVDNTVARFGRLDILVNAATGNAPDTVEAMSESTWDAAMHNIVTGMFLCCQAAGKVMAKQHSGSIINISSMYGEVASDQRIYGDSGFNSSVVYGTGKAAVNQLSRYLAAYWAKDGIRVNTLSPGGVEDEGNNHAEFRKNYTSRSPMERMMRREEIRGPLVFLASDASSYLTGQNIIVDGGFTIV